MVTGDGCEEKSGSGRAEQVECSRKETHYDLSTSINYGVGDQHLECDFNTYMVLLDGSSEQKVSLLLESENNLKCNIWTMQLKYG